MRVENGACEKLLKKIHMAFSRDGWGIGKTSQSGGRQNGWGKVRGWEGERENRRIKIKSDNIAIINIMLKFWTPHSIFRIKCATFAGKSLARGCHCRWSVAVRSYCVCCVCVCLALYLPSLPCPYFMCVIANDEKQHVLHGVPVFEEIEMKYYISHQYSVRDSECMWTSITTYSAIENSEMHNITGTFSPIHKRTLKQP